MNKVIIIDDEPLARSVLKNYLNQVSDLLVIEECSNGFEGAKAIDQHKPDLIFLDIQMPKINGFEMLEIVDHRPAVIFTTAFDEYALRAFDNHAVDYLLKPFSEERFNIALDKWKNNQIAYPEQLENVSKQPNEELRIVVQDKGAIQIIPTEKVFCIEAYDDYVKIHTAEGMYLKKKTMNYYEQTLNSKNFLRVHRSFIININYLSKIAQWEKNSYRATLTNGENIPISRSYYSKLKQILGV